MKKWWNWLLAFALFCFMFVVVPYALTRPTSEKDLKPFFDDYLKQFNKSYRTPEEYLTRFQHFMVSTKLYLINFIFSLHSAIFRCLNLFVPKQVS